MNKLLVIIPDRITEVVKKGEYQPNYYNPGDLFDEVHLLLTNDDQPEIASIQHTVGRAKLYIHNHPDDLNLVAKHNRLLTPFRLKAWARRGVEMARRIAPDMIRCHGVDWNTYLASRINAALGIPYVVSIHINLDENPVRRFKGDNLTPEQARQNAFYEYLETEALKRALLVMPVYKPILPYLARKGIQQVEVCYNILDGSNLKQKLDYRIDGPARLLYVGRLFAEKDPSNIIRAVAGMPDVHYTIVGDGPLRPKLEELVRQLDVGDRVTFRPVVFNTELCRMLSEYDLFVIHTEYFEISKSLLEALLAGLPVVMNARHGQPVPELQNGIVKLVADTVEDYGKAIRELLASEDRRAALGRGAYRKAQEEYAPAVTERKVVNIYKSILEAHD
ncbi:glycosyltransferase family 4 protein [Bradyrhizobium sediminis]|uniref:Glycosyltransferase family 4 protein n=1 Tax=Bradyrhizobium sediminis TaxID=2840469 RepID=A0A975P0Z1_9BRAD|nr:glycosyltransferase family 4 protein [Bradyrhizobium sediminis]QWG25097.1 glycosyltransferase family 4 protein [Bradyrhizobium sediminis]